MERFQEDAYDVIDRLHQNATRHSLNGNMTSLAGDDAVMDSVHSPYQWRIQTHSHRGKIIRCISWHEALQRVWRKLQLRGLVEFGHPFPLVETSSRRTTAAEFIALANQARRDSDPGKLRAQKEHVLTEMYRSVPLAVLEDMRTTFQADFEMFEYDSSPNEIFERVFGVLLSSRSYGDYVYARTTKEQHSFHSEPPSSFFARLPPIQTMNALSRLRRVSYMDAP
ncbi:hypothetical protein DPMN_079838 [Dreissena polymorpha]|uniref:Uncharacterized protein n=1 Tax=Dreissena polymorpha TaxID=45954 RepID=A0A9D4BTB5_DREPO|nr:hypothetical protein DPMN_079838 [Dreissena polymorpha]